MTRLEIAARILAGWAANPNTRGTNKEAAAVALALADALIAAAHHDAAAKALEALAVPGVAELLTMLAQDGACVTAGIGGEYPDDAQRAALTTLVKIGGDR